MNKLKLTAGVMGVLIATMSTLSCSTPADKAKKIEEELLGKGGVLYKDLSGDEPRMVTYSLLPDTTTLVLAHNLKTEAIDTLAQMPDGIDMTEIMPIEDGYLAIVRFDMQDDNKWFVYYPTLYRHIHNSKDLTTIPLIVDENNADQWATGYVIDRKDKNITLISHKIDPDYCEIYHTVYDFNGNKIAEDPIRVDIPKPQPVQTAQSYESAIYLWQCDDCGKRVNAKMKANGRPEGYYAFDNCFHSWVNLGKVY